MKYKFSVIIPIYNVEDYIEETILSVINQSIGFKENIQLILVNDGSPDDSEKICLKYKEMYPNNIIYIKQKNSGVSAARNNGFKNAKGEIINFLDSDDLWEKDTFKTVYNFLEENKNIDVAACKIKFFGAREGENHPLNYKFEKDGIVDIEKDYQNIQMSAVTAFIRKKAIKELFPTNLKYAEDSLFINKIILDKKKYGVISSAKYLYRKRDDNSSALDKSTTSKDYYLPTIKHFHKNLVDFCIKKYKKVPRYIQYVIMYELQWKLKLKTTTDVMTPKELLEYKEIITNVLKYIDDDIIVEQEYLSSEHKIETLNMKYDNKLADKIEVENDRIKVSGTTIFNLKNAITISMVEEKEKKLKVVGKAFTPFQNLDIKYYYEIKGKEKEIKFEDNKYSSTYCIDTLLDNVNYFKFEENIKENDEIKFYAKINNQKTDYLKVGFSRMSKISNKFRLHYTTKNFIIRYNKKSIKIEKQSKIKNLKYEILLLLQFIKHGKIKPFIYRTLYNITKPFIRKKIWLVSDRTAVANDNGMHLFKYIVQQNNKDIKPYFVISKKAADYEKMKKIGKVINYDSLKYKIFFLLADKIISSQADQWVTNAYGHSDEYYRDLYKFDFVFLQHGIIQNDLSSWLNYYDKNMKMFVTSAQREYDSIVDGNYGYETNDIQLTGLPRYDNLKDESQKIVAIMPTWRKYLRGKTYKNTGITKYSAEFKESEYFKHYNSLINDEDILELMRDKGYKGIFVVHPSHVNNSTDFKGNDVFEINSGFADYQKIFRESNLLVTDFSSVHFDFAYLRKPVIYSQFDKEKFFAGHIYTEGYFDYEKDCFGPVVYNYEDTKKEIIEMLKKDCKIEEKYKKRIDKFYKYKDKNNCKRVYESILKIK